MRGWVRNSFLVFGLTIIGAVLCYSPVDSSATQNSTAQITSNQVNANNISGTSILTTNYDKHLTVKDEIRDIPVESHIYDIGFVVYSKAFAERHGYPSEYIADLDPGMQALEFRMKSQGGGVDCFLNTLVDNNLNLDLPEQDFTSHFERNGDMIRFPQQIDSFKEEGGWDGYHEDPEDKDFRVRVRLNKQAYYGHNIWLASYDYMPGKQGTWADSQFLQTYTNKYYKGLDYISVLIACSTMDRKRLQREDVSLWLKKKGGDEYANARSLKPGQFVKFRIPLAFAQKSAAAIEKNGNYFYLDKIATEDKNKEE